MRGVLAPLLLVLLLAACDEGTAPRPDVASTRAVETPGPVIPPGAIPRGTAALREAERSAPPDLASLRAQGEALYGVFCTPCHGAEGRGDGPVVARGFPRPPPLGSRHSPEEIARIIAQGQGRMWPMAERVMPQERWAIAAYVVGLGGDR